MMLRRRGFLGGLAAAFAAPSIVRIESLMPVRVPIWTAPRNSNTLLTIDMITRQAVRLWKDSNAFIQKIDADYPESFASAFGHVGMPLKIRLPANYQIRNS